MKKILKNKKGFTLMEMLIVVAIIVILVVIAIPIFTGQMDNAKKAADDANERTAKAVAVNTFLADGNAITNKYFDAKDGKLETNKTDVAEAYGQYDSHKGQIIEVDVDADGNVTLTWVAPATP